ALITSQSVATRVVSQLGLDNDPEFLHSQVETFINDIGLGKTFVGSSRNDLAPKGASSNLERATYELRERHLKVERQGISYVLAISATSNDAQKAQRIATAVAQAYVDAQIEVSVEGRRRVVKSLDQRLGELRNRVLEAESAMERLKAVSGLTDTANG